MTMTVNVTGMAQLNARLQRLGKDVATKTGQAANRAGAAYVAKKIAQAAPDGPDADKSRRTRKLKNGTQVVYEHRKLNKNIKVKRIKASRDGEVINQITTGNAFHGLFVELGSIHNQPQPFFESTFEAEKQNAIDKIKVTLRKRLAKLGV